MSASTDRARTRTSEGLGLACLVVAMTAAYAAVGLFKHWHFDSSYDLGIFDQVVWHLSRFEVPGSSIRGYQNILGDHFHPIVSLLVVPYWIVPAAETLIVAQAILIAASIVPVYVFLRRRLEAAPAAGMAVAYALFWGLQKAINSDFHEIAFAPLLIAGAVLALDTRRWAWLWTTCILLVCTKEDLIPLVAAIGGYAYVQGHRRHGLALMGFGLVAFFVVLKLVIPAFGGGWSYGGAYQAVWERPWTVLAVMVTPSQKLLTVVYWLAPFCFLSLRSPLAWLIVPIAVERLLSSVSSHYGWIGHYTAPLAPLLAMSAGDGLSRLMRDRAMGLGRSRGLPAALVALSVAMALLLPGHQPILRLFTSGHYRIVAGRGGPARALASIPPDAAIVAQSALLPHLSQRATIYRLDREAPDADYVIASMTLNPWPLSGPDELAEVIQQRRGRGYVTVFDEAGWIVLRGTRRP
jgi:uncharacterized membrane protein